MVQLEPEVALGDFGDGFDTRGGDGAQDEGDIVAVGGAGEDFAGFRPHQALQAHGGNSVGVGVFAAEEGGLEGGTLVIAQVGGS